MQLADVFRFFTLDLLKLPSVKAPVVLRVKVADLLQILDEDVRVVGRSFAEVLLQDTSRSQNGVPRVLVTQLFAHYPVRKM
jgi:hypothetical protein